MKNQIKKRIQIENKFIIFYYYIINLIIIITSLMCDQVQSSGRPMFVWTKHLPQVPSLQPFILLTLPYSCMKSQWGRL